MSIDTNINNYSIEDLLVIIGLDESQNKLEITKRVDSIIGTYEAKGNEQLVNFFKNVRKKLLDSLQKDQKDDKQQDDVFTQQFQDQINKNQSQKITDRQQQITTFEGLGHYGGPIQERLRLGVSNSVPLKLGQDYINQTLRQEVTKLIVMDSQFRRDIIPFSDDPNSRTSSTNYTVDLNDQIKSCLSLELYSIFIPTTWYVFDDYLNNNYFIIRPFRLLAGGSLQQQNDVVISIQSGNYSYASIKKAINDKLKTFTYAGISKLEFDYTENINASTDGNGTDVQSIKAKFAFNTPYAFGYIYDIIFYPARSEINSKNNRYIQSFGYLLGFRKRDADVKTFKISLGNPSPSQPIPDAYDASSIAQTTIDLIGPKYFRLILDEFNSNRTNNYEIGFEKGQTKLALPSYAGKIKTNSASINLARNKSSLPGISDSSLSFPDISDTNIYIPTYPRLLTNNQLYAANQIAINSKKDDDSVRSPNDSNLFAVIPRPNQGVTANEFNGAGSYLNLSEALSSVREYFGPVDIKKFKVIIEDERGNTLNLHGHDWSFILKARSLYQY